MQNVVDRAGGFTMVHLGITVGTPLSGHYLEINGSVLLNILLKGCTKQFACILSLSIPQIRIIFTFTCDVKKTCTPLTRDSI